MYLLIVICAANNVVYGCIEVVDDGHELLILRFSVTIFIALITDSGHTHPAGQERVGGEKKMGYFILSALLACCALGWLKWKISTRAVVYYVLKKGYTPPSGEEMKACSIYVIKKMLHLKDRTGI